MSVTRRTPEKRKDYIYNKGGTQKPSTPKEGGGNTRKEKSVGGKGYSLVKEEGKRGKKSFSWKGKT